jgi:hypothetical protein
LFCVWLYCCLNVPSCSCCCGVEVGPPFALDRVRYTGGSAMHAVAVCSSTLQCVPAYIIHVHTHMHTSYITYMLYTVPSDSCVCLTAPTPKICLAAAAAVALMWRDTWLPIACQVLILFCMCLYCCLNVLAAAAAVALTWRGTWLLIELDTPAAALCMLWLLAVPTCTAFSHTSSMYIRTHICRIADDVYSFK